MTEQALPLVHGLPRIRIPLRLDCRAAASASEAAKLAQMIRCTDTVDVGRREGSRCEAPTSDD